MRRIMTAPTPGVHAKNQIVNSPPKEAAVADDHTFTLTVEASGEVTPAQPPTSDTETEPAKAEPEEADQ